MKVTLCGIVYDNVSLHWGTYADSSPALRLFTDIGPLATATVRLDTPPAEGCVWIKDWSENDGMFASLIEAGVIEDTGRVQQSGFVTAYEGRLL